MAPRIDPEIGTDTFGGIFASHLNGPAPLTYKFDRSRLRRSATSSGTPADLLREGIAFTRTLLSIPNPTSIVRGPDGRLYVSELLGTIHALTLDGANQVIADQPITTLGDRLTLGLTVDPQSTPGNVILWVSNSDPSLNAGQANSGAVTRLSGPGLHPADGCDHRPPSGHRKSRDELAAFRSRRQALHRPGRKHRCRRSQPGTLTSSAMRGTAAFGGPPGRRRAQSELRRLVRQPRRHLRPPAVRRSHLRDRPSQHLRLRLPQQRLDLRAR